MKNIPRLFIDQKLKTGEQLVLSPEQFHYLNDVMRTNRFLAFNDGTEFNAEIVNKSSFTVLDSTTHIDSSGGFTFCFAPIKRTEDLVSGITQMGAKILQPVITERTTAHHVNWNRMRKIIIENSEQSGRNSIPDLREPITFAELAKENIIYGDERKLNHSTNIILPANRGLLIGPEGGFSDSEFASLDSAGAIGVSLGKTILRAEVAAVALCAAYATKN